MKIGIDLNDCEKVNNGINDILDTANYIKEQYFLEVSSPGVERVLRKGRHLEQNIGKEIIVNLFKPINNQKQIEGILNKYDDRNIYLQQEDIIEIERKNISLIKLKFEW
ncbi:MAG: ribosome maturation factor RimP [Clostridia bacterium]|nr:ribosome maturation factor RimP [Clostridia bacterium]